ncbi:hypothetical protein KC360_g29 [Hortaea werneckii]|nr:hypothetical protein KC360_g29 [Hortaea werneckii]
MIAEMMRGSRERANVPVAVRECAVVQAVRALGNGKVVLPDSVLSVAELPDSAARPAVGCHCKAATEDVSTGAFGARGEHGKTDHFGCGRVAALAAAARAATRNVPVVILVVESILAGAGGPVICVRAPTALGLLLLVKKFLLAYENGLDCVGTDWPFPLALRWSCRDVRLDGTTMQVRINACQFMAGCRKSVDAARSQYCTCLLVNREVL